MNFLKKAIAAALLLLLLIFAFLFIVSPGKPLPMLDSNGSLIPGSISVIEKPTIGGVPQGIIIRGENIKNPVLLYVHGGPGSPEYPLIKREIRSLEKIFTICYWEQRGSGMSYSNDILPASMNLDQIVDDAAEVSRLLMRKFGKEKIYILGHSWGTAVASFTIHKYPELYHAYIGVGQISDVYMSEKESHRFILGAANYRRDAKAFSEIQHLKLPAIDASGQDWLNYYLIQRKYLMQYGGARYNQARTFNDIKKAVLFCHEYTIKDKLHYAKGASFSQTYLDPYLIPLNLSQSLDTQKIPVYIFQGLHDHQTSYSEAKKYFDLLQAPVKKFYTFTQSAHSPHLEEYPLFEKIVKEDILNQTIIK